MKLSVFVRVMGATIRAYDAIPVSMLSVCVTTGNSKIGRALNVSLPAIFSCPNCKGCAHLCYDVNDCRYSGVMRARARNWSILKRDPGAYWAGIENAIRRHPTYDAMRFHVGGDIPRGDMGADYFREMMETVRRHPDIRFWTYTKNYWIVNEYVRTHGGSIAEAIPENISIMFSEWRGIPMVNPYGFPEFRAYYDDEQPAPDAMECPGDCRKCRAEGIGCPFRMSVWTRIRGQKRARKARKARN